MRVRGSVLLMRGESVALSYSDGLADDATNAANAAGTRFQIASVSKQFAAAAALLLAERGALGPDEEVRRRIGGCPESWSGITLRHLLTHTSGLPHWFAYHEQLTGVDYLTADELSGRPAARRVPRPRDLRAARAGEHLRRDATWPP